MRRGLDLKNTLKTQGNLKTILQAAVLLFLAAVCLAGYLGAEHVLDLPFRATNDALHEKKSFMTLDFLIPGGVHIDNNLTIGQTFFVENHFNKGVTFFQVHFLYRIDTVTDCE